MFVKPHQDHPYRRGAVCSAADPLPACPEAPPDAHLHRLHRRQQGQFGVFHNRTCDLEDIYPQDVGDSDAKQKACCPFNCLPMTNKAI